MYGAAAAAAATHIIPPRAGPVRCGITDLAYLPARTAPHCTPKVFLSPRYARGSEFLPLVLTVKACS